MRSSQSTVSELARRHCLQRALALRPVSASLRRVKHELALFRGHAVPGWDVLETDDDEGCTAACVCLMAVKKNG